MWEYRSPEELYHYGILGMRWGHRKNQYGVGKRLVRGHAGPGIRLNREKRLAMDKKDLEFLKNGGHLSIGLTKKRQARYDARDKRYLEKRINRDQAKINKVSNDAKEAKRISKKKLYEMSNDDLRTLNKRKQLESDYKRLNKQKIKKGAAIVGSVAGFTASVITIKNNGGQLIKSGKEALKKVKAIKVKP